MLESDSFDQSTSDSAKRKRIKVIIFVTVSVVLLLGLIGVISAFVYRHFQKSKTLDSEPSNNIDVNPITDDKLKIQDEDLVINKPDVVNDTPKDDPLVVDPSDKDKKKHDLKPKIVDKVEDKIFKERIDQPEELNKILGDDKNRNKQENPDEKVPEIVPVSGKDAIFEKLDKFVSKKGITIVKGEFEDCIWGRCVAPKGEHVFEWELKLMAELMDEAQKPFDLNYEFETIKKYKEFSRKFSRYYFTKDENKNSFKNFRLTRDRVENHNKDPNRLYSLDYNSFSDMGDEMTQLSPRSAITKEKLSGLSKTSKNLRDQVIHVDWRDKGIIQPVIQQGSCGACWAVAATDVFNSFMAKNKKDKTRYSHQQLVDCVNPKYNCEKGGSQVDGLEYIRDHKMCSNNEYPYIYKKNQCSAYKCDKDSGIKEVVHLSKETALDFLKNNGPFAAILDCSPYFLLYGDGIFNGSCVGVTSHSVVVVGHGYDIVKNKNYWIVKNSWGTDWGEDGYFRILDEQTDPGDPSKHFCDFLEYSNGII